MNTYINRSLNLNYNLTGKTPSNSNKSYALSESYFSCQKRSSVTVWNWGHQIPVIQNVNSSPLDESFVALLSIQSKKASI